MIKVITLEKLKTVLSEMRTKIEQKFYNKDQVDEKINKSKEDIGISLDKKFDDEKIEINKSVDRSITEKLNDYDKSLDANITEKINNKKFDTSGLISKEELDIKKVITKDNLVENNLVTKEDIKDIKVDTTELLDKKSFLSEDDNTSVKKAEVSKKIQGIDEAKSLSYYGKDKDGKIGFQEFPVSSIDSTISDEELIKLINDMKS